MAEASAQVAHLFEHLAFFAHEAIDATGEFGLVLRHHEGRAAAPLIGFVNAADPLWDWTRSCLHCQGSRSDRYGITTSERAGFLHGTLRPTDCLLGLRRCGDQSGLLAVVDPGSTRGLSVQRLCGAGLPQQRQPRARAP